jgi:hypothetical protein
MLLALGIWGPWVAAGPASLRILGIDLAEYVKFVAEVRAGQIRIVREVFYLPLVLLSVSLSLLAHRPELRVPSAARWILNVLAIPAALAMLPPAWTPPLLLTPEFLKQTIAIGGCVLVALLSFPILRRLPKAAPAIVLLGGGAAAALLSLAAFIRLQPALDVIYGRSVPAGPGVWLVAAGAALLCIVSVALLIFRPPAAV